VTGRASCHASMEMTPFQAVTATVRLQPSTPKQAGMEQLQQSNARLQEDLEAIRGEESDSLPEGIRGPSGSLNRLKSTSSVVGGIDPELISRQDKVQRRPDDASL